MFSRAGEVHLRYLAWWNLFTVLTQAKRIVPLHGRFYGWHSRSTVCWVSSVGAKMALVKCEGNTRLSDPKLLPCGLQASPGLWLHGCLLFVTWMMLLAALLLPQQHRVLLMGLWVEGKGASRTHLLGKPGLPTQPLHRGDHHLLCSHGALSRVLQSVHEPFSPIWE